MAPDELSEDCKQRLRDLDRGLARVIECLDEYDFETGIQLSRELLPLLDRASAPDEPCKKALRSIDQTSSALQQIERLDQTPGSRDKVPRLIQVLGEARQRIEAILGMDVMI